MQRIRTVLVTSRNMNENDIASTLERDRTGILFDMSSRWILANCDESFSWLNDRNNGSVIF